MKNLIFLFILALSSQLIAQTIMNIHQSNGTVLQIPLNTIDSITYSGSGSSIVSNPGPGVTFNGYTYPTIILGNGQEWMAENLHTSIYANGDPIPNVTDSLLWENLNTGAWCHYYNSSQYENPYGKLYNWYAVSDMRSLCPTGWHVPSESDWNNLVMYLDPQADTNCLTCAQSSIAGGMMKSIGTQYWTSPNNSATNLIGFSAVGGGTRQFGANFLFFGISSNWWSSTEFNATRAMYRDIGNDSGNIGSNGWEKTSGYSVRCIKD